MKYNTPQVKTNMLLQCHFNRTPLNTDLRLDQNFILENSIKLIHAMVDVISSLGLLKPALLAMELSQMVVQGMWVTQSQLMQLPYVDLDTVAQLKRAKVEDIIDFMNMDDDLRQRILKINDKEMSQIAEVCNRYPNVEMTVQPEGDATVGDGEVKEVIVTIKRPDVEEI